MSVQKSNGRCIGTFQGNHVTKQLFTSKAYLCNRAAYCPIRCMLDRQAMRAVPRNYVYIIHQITNCILHPRVESLWNASRQCRYVRKHYCQCWHDVHSAIHLFTPSGGKPFSINPHCFIYINFVQSFVKSLPKPILIGSAITKFCKI